MFTNRIIAPFAVLGAVFLVLAWTYDEKYAYYFVPCLVAAALLYITSPQINWWWYTRNPPELSAELRDFLNRNHGYYQRLNETEKRRFRGRIALFNMGTDWEPLAFPEDSLPPDVQVAISAQAVMLTFHRETFLFDAFEKVIIFPRPFPTPEHPYDHASELHQADGCLLFSAEQVMLGFVKSHQWYNVALHEYARAFVLLYPSEPWPVLQEESVWDALQQVSGMARDYVESVIGIQGVDPLPVAVNHFFVFPERFAQVLPELNSAFSSIFAAPKV
jgi:hypothetical protein